MTDLKRIVSRRSTGLHRGRRLVITLYPGDAIGLKPERLKRGSEVTVSIAAVYDFAVKLEVLRRREEKRRSKA